MAELKIRWLVHELVQIVRDSLIEYISSQLAIMDFVQQFTEMGQKMAGDRPDHYFIELCM